MILSENKNILDLKDEIVSKAIYEENYTDNFLFSYQKSNILHIKDEIQALCFLCGINEKYFRYYLYVKERINHSSIEQYFSQLNPSEVEFYRLYQGSFSFLGYLIFIKNHIFEYKVWDGDIKQYVQRLYNNGVFFPMQSYSLLSLNNIKPTQGSKTYNYYKYFCNSPMWTLKQAIQLCMGEKVSIDLMATDYGQTYMKGSASLGIFLLGNHFKDSITHQSRYQHPFKEDEFNNYITQFFNQKIICDDDNETVYAYVCGDEVNLNMKLSMSVSIGEVKSASLTVPNEYEQGCFKKDSLTLFDKKDITKWIIENTEIIPPKPLIDMLFEGDTEFLEAYYEELLKGEAEKDPKRLCNQHFIVAQVYKEFTDTITAEKAWDKFSVNPMRYNFTRAGVKILDAAHCKSEDIKRNEQFTYQDTKCKPQEMTKTAFITAYQNFIDDKLNYRKKYLPENLNA